MFSGITNASWYALASGGVCIHCALLHKEPVQLPVRKTHKQGGVFNQPRTKGEGCNMLLFIVHQHAELHTPHKELLTYGWLSLPKAELPTLAEWECTRKPGFLQLRWKHRFFFLFCLYTLRKNNKIIHH